MIWINSIELPDPDRGLKIARQQLVDSARNALGQVVAQKVNRRLHKLEGLKWTYLPAATWRAVLTEIEKFTGTVQFWDARTNALLEIQVYWGDASEEPFEVNMATGEVLSYINCECNIIDMGY